MSSQRCGSPALQGWGPWDWRTVSRLRSPICYLLIECPVAVVREIFPLVLSRSKHERIARPSTSSGRADLVAAVRNYGDVCPVRPEPFDSAHPELVEG